MKSYPERTLPSGVLHLRNPPLIRNPPCYNGLANKGGFLCVKFLHTGFPYKKPAAKRRDLSETFKNDI